MNKAVIQIQSINAALSKYNAQFPKGATGNKYVHLCIIQKIYMYPTYITNSTGQKYTDKPTAIYYISDNINAKLP